MPKHPVVLFDGHCNYCNTMVNWCLRTDANDRLRFASLQSPAGKQLLQQYAIPPDTDSVVFIANGKGYTHSTAAIGICRYLSFPGNILYAFIIIPRFIRDPFYKWIARNRYRWFGRREECRIPTEKEKRKFYQSVEDLDL
ncbi:DCC1-like thiol-disulfide oxidoreductase family protein [Flavihumibacter rivuli]|uniref:thiol-disulfide oxidoreductase DCC family protein n=1 Tax=Flavihumibacter rivuli TaxID=2838156 RepID=UPI001BDDE574|nr:DCC1-like thiol-disulfide oxidoreductase family protein [Flavihumibacter rivuli]ULQ56828.1 DCC1-like thiol-disulfide oxidoreductase family protein [Flavihumibacter rivuli]